MSKYFGDFKEVARFLKKRVPLKIPVSVRRVKLKGDAAADCGYLEDKNKFLIRIDKSLPNDAAVLILLHEYAHAISWDVPGDSHHHISWAIAYSKIYKVVFEDVDEAV